MDKSALSRNDGYYVYFDYLHSFDVGLSRRLGVCANKESGTLRTVMILLEITGHGVPWIVGSVTALLVFTDLKQEFACNLFVALMFDLVVVGAIKVVVRRNRPIYNEKDMFGTISVDNYSFPSGHSTRAVMVAALFVSFVANVLWKALISFWAICVSVSRIMLGRHHVSDVVCGVAIGLLQFWMVIVFWIPRGICLEFLKLVPFYSEVRNWLLQG